MNTIQLLGWLGATSGIIGTATGISGLCLSIWTVRRDRPQLAVKLQHGYKVNENVGDYRTDYTYTMITVSNRGRRPTAIGKIWFTQHGSSQSLLVIDAFRAGTVELPEGRSRDYLAREDNLDISQLAKLIVQDGAGRNWAGNVLDKKWVKLRALPD